ncbi:MAG: cytochrome c biogenesis protein CcsA, partial [Proteobacteria bacterium]|nr:cytochrome c biogenesis protein CcsA [Pseudomonadota bacterium]
NGHALHLTAVLFGAAVAWFSVIAWFVWNLKLIGAFTAPLIALLLMVDAFFSGWVASDAAYDLNLLPNSLVLQLHIATAIIGQAFAIGACGTSLMLLWQERKLKKRQIGDVPVSFPAMDSLGRALASCLWIGFIFITVGLLTGAIIVQTGVVSDGFSIAGKAAWAILVWGWYLTILVLQNILSYRPQKIARMSLIGFALLALTWFGMGFSALSGGAP